MATITTICNRALQDIKVSKRISDITENSKESNALEEAYPETLDFMLEIHDWNFAITRVKLARQTATPAFGYQYQYTVPSDFIRLVGVWDNTRGRGQLDYRIESATGVKVLATDATNVYLKYVRRVEDPNLMPPTFRLAFAKRLGAAVCVALTDDKRLRSDLLEEFTGEDLPTAKSADAIQDRADDLPESSWVNVRYGDAEEVDPAEPA